jgi:hypothetical protein
MGLPRYSGLRYVLNTVDKAGYGGIAGDFGNKSVRRSAPI